MEQPAGAEQIPDWARDGCTFVAGAASGQQRWRHVVPYDYAFKVNAKARWFGTPLLDVFSKEFVAYTREEYADRIRDGRFSINGRVVTATHPSVSSADDEGTDWVPRVVIKQRDVIEHSVRREEAPVLGAPLQVIGVSVDLGIVAIAKPPTMPVHPCGRYHTNTVVVIAHRALGLEPSDGAIGSVRNSAAAWPQWRYEEGYIARSEREGNTVAIVDRDGAAALEVHMSAVASGGGEEAAAWLSHRAQQQQASPAPAVSPSLTSVSKLHVVHRLDKCTSGVVLLATSTAASKALFHALQDKTRGAHSSSSGASDARRSGIASIRKRYLARVDGRFDPAAHQTESASTCRPILPAELVSHRLAACDNDRASSSWFVVERGVCQGPRGTNVMRCLTIDEQTSLDRDGDDESASTGSKRVRGTEEDTSLPLPEGTKSALTLLRVVGYVASGTVPTATDTIVECIPVTGRSHQLRLHLALCGHPICGDTKYGGAACDDLLFGGPAPDIGSDPTDPAAICLHAAAYTIEYDTGVPATAAAADTVEVVFDAPVPSWGNKD